ncbi:hypothetical protein LJ707_02695 [Mucilaginibacter sp. UR6-1]|uniref:hypothetical protein n=1 Tax=Mucilaginibacter sp. UR6-1 TaxID=1435643 RepID=UPI001E423FD7|nr:hypothetical protein [Mucilaginibacter sp. UR6-1]MCC8407820.1 hypothetical protein [Mucilaginibacter sp. UR6-1]
MKKNRLVYILLIVVVAFQACKKEGEPIIYPSFGQLKISGSTSSALIIAVDGKVTDTLASTSGSDLVLTVEEGKRKISLLDSLKKTVLDTTITIKSGSITNLSNFFYTGDGLLFPDPDSTRKPTPGHALVRIVITDKNLPDVLNIDIVKLDFATGESTPVAHIDGLTKSAFSGYIDLSDPLSADAFYVIEGTDLSGNKVMSIESGNYGIISYDTDINVGLTFLPNSIISLGIGPIPSDGSLPFHDPLVIFKRIATP